jgi:hypothetical protein
MLVVVLEEVLAWCLALPLAWLQNFPCRPSTKLSDVQKPKGIFRQLRFSESLKMPSQWLVMLGISLFSKLRS